MEEVRKRVNIVQRAGWERGDRVERVKRVEMGERAQRGRGEGIWESGWKRRVDGWIA